MSDIIVLDCDSMVYLACYKEPSKAKRRTKLLEDIGRVQKSLGGDEIYPLFKGKNNFRYNVIDTYKGNRDESKMDEEQLQLREWVADLTDWAGEHVGMTCHGAEADDYVGILNKQFTEQGHNVIMSHIDKDLNQLIGYHHNFNKNELYTVLPRDGYYMLYKQTLMGDAADNITGLNRIGVKTAEKMLDACEPYEWWEMLCDAYKKEFNNEWAEKLRICANLVFMRTREEDLRDLSFEEVKDIYQWEQQTLVIGLSAVTQDSSCQQESSDLSMKSLIELLDDDTSERNKSTATPSKESLEKSEEQRQSKNQSGKNTRAAVNRSTKTSNRSAKKTLSS